MKSKISLFNKAVFKRNLKGGIGIWAGLLGAYLFLLPLQVYRTLADTVRYMDPGGEEWLTYRIITSLWRMGLFVPLSAIFSVGVAMFVFLYLFTGRNSNMVHTFPVSRMSLFVTNYVTGLLFLIIPQAVGACLSLLVGMGFGITNTDVVRACLLWIGVAAAESFFFFSMAVCVLMFVGNIIAVPVLFFILNFLYQGCGIILSSIISAVCFGVVSVYDFGFRFLTPIAYMTRIGIVPSVQETKETAEKVVEQYLYPFQKTEVLVGYAAAAVVFVLIAIIAYKKKHVETAGDVITVGWLKPIFRWGVAACTASLGAMLLADMLFLKNFVAIVISVLLIGTVFFFIAQVILDRTVRVFTKKRIRECIIYSAVMFALYIGMEMDVFGIERKVPAMDEIVRVRVNGYLDLYAVDQEEIAWVQDIHKQIVDAKKEIETFHAANTEMGYVHISYQLKNGKLERDYRIPRDDVPGSVGSQIIDYAKRPDVILKGIFGIHYPDIEVYSAMMNLFLGQYGIDDTEQKKIVSDRRISDADAKRLYKALVKDVQAGHYVNGYEASNSYGCLTFYIRDRQGFESARDSYYMNSDKTPEEVQVDVPLETSYQYLNEELHKLGYISDVVYKEISRQQGL